MSSESQTSSAIHRFEQRPAGPTAAGAASNVGDRDEDIGAFIIELPTV